VLDLAKRFCETFGVSGFEEQIRDAIREEIAGLVNEVRVDAMGNLVALRRGTGQAGKRVMLAAHMDQIGLMVSYVDNRGFLSFTPVGYLYALACWGGQVRFADGTVGTIGLDGRVDPRSKLPTTRDMYVDVGATERAQVKQQVGDVAAFMQPFIAQGDAWFAPNMDDRIGCAILAQLLRDLSGKEIAHDLYAVFTTQEEVGTRGATSSAYAIEPDVAVAIDVTGTGDTPHQTPAMEVYMGRGAAVKVQDSGMISHSGLNRLLIAAAQGAGVPYQLEVLQGGTTDARSMQVSRSGVPASCISVPSRYVHLPSQLIDRRDAEGAVSILSAFLSRPIDL
jgi:tetrahedral aminopeptidase